MRTISRTTFWVVGLIFLFRSLSAAAPEPDYQAAVKYYQEKNYAKAVPYFLTALKQHPEHYQAHQYLGNCYVYMGRISDAIEQYDEFMTHEPNNTALRNYVDKLRPTPPALPEISNAPTTERSPGLNDGSYVWDPAADPYPKFTDAAKPLAKPINFTPDWYLEAIYRKSFYAEYYFASGGDDLGFRLHYSLLPNFSLGVGYEYWTVPFNTTYGYYIPFNDTSFNASVPVAGIYAQTFGETFGFIGGIEVLDPMYSVHTTEYNYTTSTYDNYATNGSQIMFAGTVTLDVELMKDLGLTFNGCFRAGEGARYAFKPGSPYIPFYYPIYDDTYYLFLDLTAFSGGVGLKASF